MTGVKKKMHGKLELHSVSLPREMYTSNKKKCYILKALKFAKSLSLLGLELKNESLLKAERCV